MNDASAYRGLNFNLRRRRVPQRLLFVALCFVMFTVLWWIVPYNAIYWLLSPFLLILVWMASYGWRPAVAHLVKFLQSLEKL